MKTAVVLFNLGGPDSLSAVKPFLFNLFNDPAIIGLPSPVRWLLARLISSRRAGAARAIYARLGGASPLLANTLAQADALAAVLEGTELGETRTFIAMRYWHPMTAQVVRTVKTFSPDRVILIPLYPQFSTTTTASSLAAWAMEACRAGLDAPTRAVCCYPTAPGFVAAVARLARAAHDEAAQEGRPRVLFSAHGLPKRIVAAGDPYRWQVEQTAAAVADALMVPDLDWTVCYQSRVGPLEWIGPATDGEIERAGRQGVPVVVVPIAFVSEHSETLVELDMDYGRLAEKSGVPCYRRVPTVGVEAEFMTELAALVRRAAATPASVSSGEAGRQCPPEFSRCACRATS